MQCWPHFSFVNYILFVHFSSKKKGFRLHLHPMWMGPCEEKESEIETETERQKEKKAVRFF